MRKRLLELAASVDGDAKPLHDCLLPDHLAQPAGAQSGVAGAIVLVRLLALNNSLACHGFLPHCALNICSINASTAVKDFPEASALSNRVRASRGLRPSTRRPW